MNKPASWLLWKTACYFDLNKISTPPDFWFWVGISWAKARTKDEFVRNLNKYLPDPENKKLVWVMLDYLFSPKSN